jgi:hypothetical protein
MKREKNEYIENKKDVAKQKKDACNKHGNIPPVKKTHKGGRNHEGKHECVVIKNEAKQRIIMIKVRQKIKFKNYLHAPYLLFYRVHFGVTCVQSLPDR